VASRYDSPLLLLILTIGTWLDDRIGSLWGDWSAPTLFNFIKHTPTSEYGCVPIPWHTKRVCRNSKQMISISIVVGILRIHGTTGGWTVWALSGQQRIRHVFKAWRFNWCVVSPCGNGHYFVVRQSQLGEARMVFGCQTVPIGRDKYVIRSASLFVHMVAAAVDTLWAGTW